MINWRISTLNDLELLQNCAIVNNIIGNNYSAVNSVLYQKKYQAQISFDDGFFYEKLSFGGNDYFTFPHKLNSEASLSIAIKKLTEEAEKNNNHLVFDNITTEEKDVLLEFFPDAKVQDTPSFSDYIYLTSNLAQLPGKKYSKKRNHINQFKTKHPNYTFELIKPENLMDARKIEDMWLAEASEKLSDLEAEKEIIYKALENFELFSKVCGMTGGLLYVEEKPVAFCIASLLSQNITDVHFEKCLSTYARDGGYAIINNEFSKTVQTEYINREEDLGIEGLRKAKLSYYPEKVLEKFRVEIRLNKEFN